MFKSPLDDSWFRQRVFDDLVRGPVAWLRSAMDLKAAADRLNWRDKPVEDHEPSVGLIHVYRMIIGMCIESLLKGIMVAEAKVDVLDKNRRLSADYKTHDLVKLAGKIDPTKVAFSDDELRVLKETTPYIEWGGRYPFPVRADELVSKLHTGGDMDIELKLYDRLYEHLACIDWDVKGGKRRDLKTKKSL